MGREREEMLHEASVGTEKYLDIEERIKVRMT